MKKILFLFALVFLSLIPQTRASFDQLNWSFYRVLNITNLNTTRSLPNDYTINFTLDTTGAKFLDSGDDVRITFNGQEINRTNSTPFNSISTVINFMLQNNLSAGANTTNYSIYYGYALADSPAQNGSYVYLDYCDFKTFCNWTFFNSGNAGWSIAGQVLNWTSNASTSDTAYGISPKILDGHIDQMVEAYIYSPAGTENYGQVFRAINFAPGGTLKNGNNYESLIDQPDRTVQNVRDDNVRTELNSNTPGITFLRENWYEFRTILFMTNISFYINNTFRTATVQPTFGPQGNGSQGVAVMNPTTANVSFRNWKVKRYETPGFNVTIQPETSNLQANAGFLMTFNVYDEETFSQIPYIISISNISGSSGTSFFFGHNTIFGSVTNAASWTQTDSWLSCDHDTSTNSRFTCNNVANCNAAGSTTMDLICDISIPYYNTNSTNNATFNIRGVSSNSEGGDIQVLNINTLTYETIKASHIFATSTRTDQYYINNLNGKYGQGGTARIKITLSSAANGRWIDVYDMWTTNSNTAPDIGALITNTQIQRNATANGDNGGIPFGSVTITLSSTLTSGTTYPERTFYTTLLNGGATTQNFYLLKSTSGASVNFLTLLNFNPLADVLVTTQRNLNGSFVNIGQKKSSSDGGAPIFLKLNTDYKVIASKAGFNTATVTVNPPSAVTYQINLLSSAASSFQTIFSDLNYQFIPINNVIQGGKMASINLTTTAPNSNLQSWGFNTTLVKANGSQSPLSQSTSSESSGGFMSASINLSNATTLDRVRVNAYWTRVTGETASIQKFYTVTTSTPQNSSLFNRLTSIRTEADPVSWHIAIGLITLLVCGFISFRMGIGGMGVGIIALGIIGMFTFMGFFDVTMFSLLVIALGGLYLIGRGFL